MKAIAVPSGRRPFAAAPPRLVGEGHAPLWQNFSRWRKDGAAGRWGADRPSCWHGSRSLSQPPPRKCDL